MEEKAKKQKGKRNGGGSTKNQTAVQERKERKERRNVGGTRHSTSTNSYFLSVSVSLRTPSPNPCSPQRNRLRAPKGGKHQSGSPLATEQKGHPRRLGCFHSHGVLTSLLTSPCSSLKDGDGTLPALIQQPMDFVAPVVTRCCMPQQELVVAACEGFAFTAKPLRSLCSFGSL